jgi:hypothetical protein
MLLTFVTSTGKMVKFMPAGTSTTLSVPLLQ